MKEVFVIVLHGCTDDLGVKLEEPIESVDFDSYPSNWEIEEGMKMYGAKYAQVEKRYKLK